MRHMMCIEPVSLTLLGWGSDRRLVDEVTTNDFCKRSSIHRCFHPFSATPRRRCTAALHCCPNRRSSLTVLLLSRCFLRRNRSPRCRGHASRRRVHAAPCAGGQISELDATAARFESLIFLRRGAATLAPHKRVPHGTHRVAARVPARATTVSTFDRMISSRLTPCARRSYGPRSSSLSR